MGTQAILDVVSTVVGVVALVLVLVDILVLFSVNLFTRDKNYTLTFVKGVVVLVMAILTVSDASILSTALWMILVCLYIATIVMPIKAKNRQAEK